MAPWAKAELLRRGLRGPIPGVLLARAAITQCGDLEDDPSFAQDGVRFRAVCEALADLAGRAARERPTLAQTVERHAILHLKALWQAHREEIIAQAPGGEQAPGGMKP